MKLDILGLSSKEKKVLSCLLSDIQTASKNEDSNKSETLNKDENKKINTPLLIHRETGMSRTAIYHILGILKKRDLIERYKEKGKFYYRMVSDEEIANKLYEIKRELLGYDQGRIELSGILPAGKVPKAEGVNLGGEVRERVSDVVIHQGLPAVKACFTKMFTENKNCKFIGVQGNNTLPLYGEYLGKGFVDKLNKQIKDNKIIVGYSLYWTYG